MISKKILKSIRVPPGEAVQLADYATDWDFHPELVKLGKEQVREAAGQILAENQKALAEAQELLWASDTWSVLVVLQAMDAAGKDGIIKHVMSGINPQGCQVFSFKVPSAEEVDHNFLWRYMRALPERGRIGIFNRSYYEDVLVVRVHPEILERQRLPVRKFDRKFWDARYDDINRFERHLVRNGTMVLKFFLHISKDEQRRRFIDRLEDPEKHWKFSLGDLGERQHWDAYQEAYQDALNATSTKWAPWYVIPSDLKVTARALVSEVMVSRIGKLKLDYPEVSGDVEQRLADALRALRAEATKGDHA
ncbi:MAG TPA: polyphosphate kinase 2 family protein [Arthrobacter sp.]